MTDKIMEMADAHAEADAEAHHKMEFGNQERFDAAIYKTQQARSALAEAIKAEQDYTRAVISECDQWMVDYTEMKIERDEYQRCADTMAAEHKVERDALMAANQDCLLHFDTLKADYDRLRKVAQQALEALKLSRVVLIPSGVDCTPKIQKDAIEALRKELAK